MSGHSKWSTIKRKKGVADQKRGQQFSKIVRTITIAAKEDGPDPEANFKLRLAIDKAKEANMPSANVERAISGASKDSLIIEEINYEAYGPYGVALLIRAVTDNRNRASSDIKAILTKYNGSMGGTGSVSWMFEQKGLVIVDAKDLGSSQKEELELSVIDLGAEDLEDSKDIIEIYIDPKKLHKLSKGLKKEGYKVTTASLEMNPINMVKIDDESKAQKIIKLIDLLENLEDVDSVYANFDIPKEILEKI